MSDVAACSQLQAASQPTLGRAALSHCHSELVCCICIVLLFPQPANWHCSAHRCPCRCSCRDAWWDACLWGGCLQKAGIKKDTQKLSAQCSGLKHAREKLRLGARSCWSAAWPLRAADRLPNTTNALEKGLDAAFGLLHALSRQQHHRIAAGGLKRSRPSTLFTYLLQAVELVPSTSPAALPKRACSWWLLCVGLRASADERAALPAGLMQACRYRQAQGCGGALRPCRVVCRPWAGRRKAKKPKPQLLWPKLTGKNQTQILSQAFSDSLELLEALMGALCETIARAKKSVWAHLPCCCALITLKMPDEAFVTTILSYLSTTH